MAGCGSGIDGGEMVVVVDMVGRCGKGGGVARVVVLPVRRRQDENEQNLKL